MAKIPTVMVKFKEGKFKGEVMRINAQGYENGFNPSLHEMVGKPKVAAAPKGKGKGK